MSRVAQFDSRIWASKPLMHIGNGIVLAFVASYVLVSVIERGVSYPW